MILHPALKTSIYGWSDQIIITLITQITSTSVVPIKRITTIGNSRLLGNFLTIGIGRFYDCIISLLKSDDLLTLYLKLNQIFVINLLILTKSYNFVHFIVCL